MIIVRFRPKRGVGSIPGENIFSPGDIDFSLSSVYIKKEQKKGTEKFEVLN